MTPDKCTPQASEVVDPASGVFFQLGPIAGDSGY